MRLKDKVALIAGAGPGMGRATALLFAQEGARVGVIARDPDKGKETVRRIAEAGGEAIGMAGDLANPEEVGQAVQAVVERWGKLDILYYGAGGFFRPDKGFDEVDEEFWHLALSNTLDGLYNLAQIVRPHLRGGGVILTVAASFSVRQEGNPAYGAAKGGIIGLTQSLAKAFYADDIRVNCIGSGLIRASLADGPVNPVPSLARTGHPEDIAYAALYLASDEASWVTGQVLNIDGGVDMGTRPLWEFEK
jgi:3-oxoacyl-[acyl-carrier protein] reductase